MRKLFAGALLAAVLMVPGVVRAEEESPNTGSLSLSGGVDYVTEYYFRGYKSSPSGFIIQPYAQVNVAAYESDSFSITPYVGTWNNIQDTTLEVDADGTGSPNGKWYESDIYGGVVWGLPYHLKLDTIYTLYTSPSNAFKTIGEAGAKLSYDDSEFMKDQGLPFTLTPYVAYYYETFNDTPDSELRQYAEVGLTPTIPLGDSPFTASFPLVVGLSPDGYYTDEEGRNEVFGYWSAGSYLSYALPFGKKYGSWTLSAGVTYVQAIADSAEAANGDDHEWIGKVSLTFAY